MEATCQNPPLHLERRPHPWVLLQELQVLFFAFGSEFFLIIHLFTCAYIPGAFNVEPAGLDGGKSYEGC
jgi:hypothetical protein